MPFHEYECTGIKRYLEFVPLEDPMAEFEEQKKEGYYSDSDTLEDFIKEYYGSDCYQLGGVWGRMTNPNARWDWWMIGGRWGIDNAIMSKDGLREWQEKRTTDKMQEYHRWHEAYNSVTESDIEHFIEQCKEYLSAETSQAKVWNAYYHMDFKQFAHDRATFDKFDWLLWNLDDVKSFNLSESDYKEKFEGRAMTAAFINHQGEWCERGRMGWFAMCDDENANRYDGPNGDFWQFVNSAPDDAVFYLVDCHI